MQTTPIVILLGPPGSGKGTQAKQLSKKLDYHHLSTGDLLRSESQKETVLGKKIRTYIDHGELVPDEIIVNILLEYIDKNNNLLGIILDGFPRTLAQAQLLYKKYGIKNTIVFFLEVEDTIIINRIIQRRMCVQCGHLYHLEFYPPKKLGLCDICNGKLEQRFDDNESIIKKRLEIYHKEMPSTLQFYENQGILIHIKANKSQKQITESIIYELSLHKKF